MADAAADRLIAGADSDAEADEIVTGVIGAKALPFNYQQNVTPVFTVSQGGEPIAHTVGSVIVGTRQLQATEFLGIDEWWWFELYIQFYAAAGGGSIVGGQPIVVDFLPLLDLFDLNVIGAREGMPIGHAGGQIANADADMLHAVFTGATGTACALYDADGAEVTVAINPAAGDVIYMTVAFMANLGN